MRIKNLSRNMFFISYFIFCFVFYFIFYPHLDVHAVNMDEKIRVGLESNFKSVSELKIKNKEICIGTNETFNDYRFKSATGFTIAVSNKTYKKQDENYLSYQDALESKNKYFADGIICFDKDNTWTIWNEYSDTIESKDSENINDKTLLSTGKHIMLLENKSPLVIFTSDTAQIKSLDDFINLGDKKYRGFIEFGFYDSNKITAVNILLIDEYLYGVVPSEMPASWPEEALKAQAVAARTYAKSKFRLHKYYDLCDCVHCQAYSGIKNESERVNKLIDATKNILILYKNEPIDAVFFSSSGGVTEDSENVWQNPCSYLRSKPDIYETNSKIWTRSFKLSEIKKILESNKTYIGDIVDIKILEYSNSERVKKLLISGTLGEKILTKEEIINFFSKTKDGSLPSRLFTVEIKNLQKQEQQQEQKEPVIFDDEPSSENTLNLALKETEIDKIETDSTVTFYGRGYGHGVGMSQYGAKGMADAGFKFDEILKYYYTGVAVRKI